MKRLLSLLIIICIICLTLPFTTLAEESYLNESEAAELLREAMTERQTSLAFKLKTAQEPSNATFSQLMELALEVTDNPVEGDYLRWHIGGYKGGGSVWVQGGFYYCELTFNISYYTTAEQELELDNAIDDVIDSFGFNDNTSDIEKVAAIYNYICDNVSYESSTSSDGNKLKYSAYSAMIKKSTVCQGYASLLYRMLREVGLDNRIIAGTSYDSSHAWNIVKLDGEYYNLDSTWDAGQFKYEYFLKCSAHFENHTRDEEYTSSAFTKQYPISELCYDVKHASDKYICAAGHHDFGDWYTFKTPTCVFAGIDRRDCHNCEYYEETATPRVKHKEGEWVIIVPAEINKNGIKEKRCIECDALIDTREIPALNEEQHVYHLGDINGNDKIDKYDYIAVKRVVMNAILIDDSKLSLADINKNGKVEKYDYILLKRHVMGTFTIVF